ncbi:MAG: hypothetical protein Tsb009_13450 [Planctomycetaceae bacterium]
MKKTILSLAAVALIAGLFVRVPAAKAQNNRKEIPHKVGLIDMAEIFKNYKKFTDLRESLKTEIEKSNESSKKLVADLQALNKKLKDKTYADDSPEKKAWRKQLIELTTRYQAFQKTQQAEFLDKESKIYKTVYLDVTDAVKEYAKYYQYTLILRYNKQGVREATNPKDVLSRMNRLVVYVRPGEDITDPVLRYLNQKYESSRVGSKR